MEILAVILNQRMRNLRFSWRNLVISIEWDASSVAISTKSHLYINLQLNIVAFNPGISSMIA